MLFRSVRGDRYVSSTRAHGLAVQNPAVQDVQRDDFSAPRVRDVRVSSVRMACGVAGLVEAAKNVRDGQRPVVNETHRADVGMGDDRDAPDRLDAAGIRKVGT